MSALKKIIAATALTLMASTASAALIEVQSQTQSKGFTLTTWLDTFTFNLFDAVAAGGALQKVEFSLSGDSTTVLTFNAATDSFVSGTAGSKIYADISIGGNNLDINIAPVGSFGQSGPGEKVTGGSSLQLGPLLGSDSTGLATTNAAELALFSAPGTFDVDMMGLASLTLASLGGNASSQQVSSSSAIFGVKYFIEQPVPSTNVPTPGTLALVGLGLLALRARKSA